ncbi:MAG: ANTAR domain-containing protein [Defluviitaleaceae bacterium]|nr:ANTAR domain-containing protein [Defluviitaleaceae bacterium]MCL2274051.1 ANTAR domain-containing protein [Defluviitaleaceae bacterium]
MFCLVASDNNTRAGVFAKLLKQAYADAQIITVHTCGEARRVLLSRDFVQVIIDAPLRDENGEALSRHVKRKGLSQVILCVPYVFFDEASALCENEGVLMVAKPFDVQGIWTAVKLAKSAQHNQSATRENDAKMAQKLKDIRLVDRAKRLLISCENMTEQEAHRHIEKQAMDARCTKRAAAQEVINRYEPSL